MYITEDKVQRPKDNTSELMVGDRLIIGGMATGYVNIHVMQVKGVKAVCNNGMAFQRKYSNPLYIQRLGDCEGWNPRSAKLESAVINEFLRMERSENKELALKKIAKIKFEDLSIVKLEEILKIAKD